MGNTTNKPERYQRISEFTMPGDNDFKSDELRSKALNEKLEKWLYLMKKEHPDFNYRITNSEHISLPAPAFAPGKPIIGIAINIAYTI